MENGIEGGNRLFTGRMAVKIHLRNGVSWVTECRGGESRRYTAGEWFRMNRGGAALAYAYRRGDLGIESLLPEAMIDAMHAARGARPTGSRAWWSRLRVALRLARPSWA